MKATNLTKKITALFLTLVMASVLAVPAFATAVGTGVPFRASGNGWSSTTIVKNGVSYTLNAGVAMDSSDKSGYTALETPCNCKRSHSIVTMVYRAAGDGNVTVKSSSARSYNSVTGTTESYKATPSSSYGAFQSLVSISGSITVSVINQDSSTASATLSPKLTNG